VAKSDDEFSSIEKTTLEVILKKKFDLSSEAVEELIEIAHRKREESVDLWEFTHLAIRIIQKERRRKSWREPGE
jgi:uncharacterized tellurite resistance protein B-like protein